MCNMFQKVLPWTILVWSLVTNNNIVSKKLSTFTFSTNYCDCCDLRRRWKCKIVTSIKALAQSTLVSRLLILISMDSEKLSTLTFSTIFIGSCDLDLDWKFTGKISILESLDMRYNYIKFEDTKWNSVWKNANFHLFFLPFPRSPWLKIKVIKQHMIRSTMSPTTIILNLVTIALIACEKMQIFTFSRYFPRSPNVPLGALHDQLPLCQM